MASTPDRLCRDSIPASTSGTVFSPCIWASKRITENEYPLSVTMRMKSLYAAEPLEVISPTFRGIRGIGKPLFISRRPAALSARTVCSLFLAMAPKV
jgi:hypothetical protein